MPILKSLVPPSITALKSYRFGVIRVDWQAIAAGGPSLAEEPIQEYPNGR